MSILPTDFYCHRDTATIAADLLGKLLVHETVGGLIGGLITETEAYLASGDPASHSYRGQTPRNLPMFGPPGTSYVYISYGIHRCFNVVCQAAGNPEAVLIRALQPVHGITLMRDRRGNVADKQLCNGPGKLCQALGIGLALNGHLLQCPPLYILAGPPATEIETTARIGISVGKDLPLRFVWNNAQAELG